MGPPLNGNLTKKSTFPTALVISLSAAAAAVIAGLIARFRARKRRAAKQAKTKKR